jgi:hypothetical protein
MAGRPVSWTFQEDGILCALRQDGYTASMIAQEMGKTRSAVLGRLYRLGIKKDVRVGISSQEGQASKPAQIDAGTDGGRPG